MSSLPPKSTKPPNPYPMLDNSPAPAGSTPALRTGWIWIASISGFCLSIYCTTVFLGWKAAWKKSQELEFEQDADVSDRYDWIATCYDNELDLSEKLMFLTGKRKRMCQQARGHVLEVSAGTGRNGQFYASGPSGQGSKYMVTRSLKRQEKKNIYSITFVDQSSKMLEICAKRWREKQADFGSPVNFVVADAGAKGKILPPRDSGGFDTIIQTFGLCSMTDPVEYMKTMSSLLKKPSGDGDEGGRILLLEHGRGYYGWINYVLDGMAKEHADRFGCWWNRDISQIVEKSGLRIAGLKRYHFGTTWALELTHPGVVDGDGKKTN